MHLKSGKCLKCEASISNRGRMLPCYTQKRFRLDSGNVLVVAFCDQCTVSKDDFEEIAELHKSQFGGIDQKILSVERSESYKDIKLLTQQGKCVVCLGDLGDHFVHSNGLLLHEKCTISDPRYQSRRITAHV